jgi:hypothetical protein
MYLGFLTTLIRLCMTTPFVHWMRWVQIYLQMTETGDFEVVGIQNTDWAVHDIMMGLSTVAPSCTGDEELRIISK